MRRSTFRIRRRSHARSTSHATSRSRRRTACSPIRCGLVALIAAVVLASLAGLQRIDPNAAAVKSNDDGFLRLALSRAVRHLRSQDGRRLLQVQRFRRDLEKQLTEAVIKEINLRTPYRVVGNHEEADSLLTGTINVRRQEPGRRGPDQPARELNATITVWVNWTHNPPTEIEDNQHSDDRLRNDQLRPGSRRDDLERLQPGHPEHRQADRGYDGAALVQTTQDLQ